MKKRWIFVPVLIVFCIGIILGIEIKEPQKVRSVKTFTAFFGVTGDEAVKHIWLPQVVLSDNFEETWNQYLKAYYACNPDKFFEYMQSELNRRVE